MAIEYSETWIKEKRNFLKAYLPKKIQGKLFQPESEFYLDYENNLQVGLDKMADRIFFYLGIERNECIVGFYSKQQIPDSSADTAGFFTKQKDASGVEREIIMIETSHQNDATDVAAILVHEMMHLYLYRLNIELPDRQENELLTDLATIETGLGLVSLNGMNIHNDFMLTIIIAAVTLGQRIVWRSGEGGYGYFKPKDYAKQFFIFTNDLGVSSDKLAKYMVPGARRLVSVSPVKKFSDETEYTVLSRKRFFNKKKAQIKLVVIIFVVLYLLLRYGR